MKNGAEGALFTFAMPEGSYPILELPGFELHLPRRQIDQPPLFHANGRPMAQALLLHRLGIRDDGLDRPAKVLRRLVSDEVDEFRLAGYGSTLLPNRFDRRLRLGRLGRPSPILARPLLDEIDEFRLVRHRTRSTPSG